MDDVSLVKLLESAMDDAIEQYRHLRDLSNEQLELLSVEHPDTERVAELMKQKFETVDSIKALDEQNRPLKERWETSYVTFTSEERQKIADKRDETINMIEELKGLEDQIANKLLHCRKEVDQQLHSLSKGQQAAKAYYQMESMPPRFLDKKK